MNWLLAIETATRAGAVVAWSDGEVLEQQRLGDRNHAVRLAPVCADLVARLGPPSGYGIDIGPGSFTGLRVGVAFLKGLARGHPAPAIGVSSLEILATDLLHDSRPTAWALAVLEASGPYVFAGAFRRAESDPDHIEPWERLPVGLYTPAQLPTPDEGCRVGGSGLDKLDFAGVEMGPSADVLARLAASRLDTGGVAAQLEPAYHQPSAAEVNLQR